jgi:putative PIG3 family NAD(P)H quinone oxidoreductase
MTMMRCIEIPEPGGPEALVLGQRERPAPGEGEVLIKVHAAGVNRPDAMQRAGNYPPPPGASDIPGLEISGTVEALGEGVTRYREGERVCALISGGGYAEYAVAHELCTLPVPDGLSMEEAAAVPETFFTVWTNVFERSDLSEGSTFLVHGGTSGIGTTAIQLARSFGARVFATAGSDEKCRAAEEIGAELCVNYREADFVEVLKEATGGHGIDVTLDMVGGDYVARNMKVAAKRGRIVNIAFQKGSKIEVNMMPVMLKRLTLTGSTLRIRSPEEKGEIAQSLMRYVWPMFARGEVKPIMDRSFPLENAADAHAALDADHIGKIVLMTGA